MCVKLTISSGERMPNCTLFTCFRGAFESLVAILTFLAQTGSNVIREAAIEAALKKCFTEERSTIRFPLYSIFEALLSFFSQKNPNITVFMKTTSSNFRTNPNVQPTISLNWKRKKKIQTENLTP